jgi:hypothetical protein
MPLEQYAADFDSDALALLRRLLQSPEVKRTELSFSTPGCDTALPRTPAQRDAMYANLTDTLIRRSSLLLALWDGQSSPLPGGTADTVLRYLGVRTADSDVADAIEFVEAPAELDSAARLVFWISAARSGGAAATEVREPCFLLGLGDNVLQMQQTMPSHLISQLTALNRYNEEFRKLSEQHDLGAPDSLLAALPHNIVLGDRSELEEVDAQYAKADGLAVYYQRRSDSLFNLFGIMAFTMGLAYLIYDKLTDSRMLLFAYLAILLVSLGLYYFLQRKHWFAKHLTYRALAETMRAKFYLRLAGVDHRVDAGEVLALSGIDRFQGFDWVGYVLKSVAPPDVHAFAQRASDLRQSQWVEQVWIENQHRYFTKKVALLERSSRRVKILRNTMFIVIVVVILALFLFGELLEQTDLGIGVPVKNVLTFLMGFLAVLLGVWELHQDKMATRELLWQYRNQLGHFSRARLQLSRIAGAGRRSEVLAELGKDSLMESYLWAIHRYHREHEPPGGTP